jgi:threonine synthase
MKAVIFIGSGKISTASSRKRSTTAPSPSRSPAISTTPCSRVQRSLASELGIYLVNSVNPFRLEGQKTIMFRVLEALRWQVPDWIVVPGGNLGNSSAFGKAFIELKAARPDRPPPAARGHQRRRRQHALRALRKAQRPLERRQARPAIIASTTRNSTPANAASTIASAIEINRPVNLTKCLRALEKVRASAYGLPRREKSWTTRAFGLRRSTTCIAERYFPHADAPGLVPVP